MASDWLELDARDDWVRYDAEIVRSIPHIPPESYINHTLGTTTRASICVIFKHPNCHPSFST